MLKCSGNYMARVVLVYSGIACSFSKLTGQNLWDNFTTRLNEHDGSILSSQQGLLRVISARIRWTDESDGVTLSYNKHIHTKIFENENGTVYWHHFSHSITFHTNRKSSSVPPESLQKLFYNMVYSSSTCGQSLKLLQSFDKAGDLQEWCEKCRLSWSNFCTESATFWDLAINPILLPPYLCTILGHITPLQKENRTKTQWSRPSTIMRPWKLTRLGIRPNFPTAVPVKINSIPPASQPFIWWANKPCALS